MRLRTKKQLQSYSCALLLAISRPLGGQAAEFNEQASWVNVMLAARAALVTSGKTSDDAALTRAWFQVKEAFPIEWDWMMQDAGRSSCLRWLQSSASTSIEQQVITKCASELGTAGKALLAELRQLSADQRNGNDRRWLELYVRACEQRREQRLKTVLAEASRIVFTKRHTVRPSFFAYTEGQSDAQNERHFVPGTELCLLEMQGLRGQVRVLLADTSGVIRDPAVSWDGQRLAFAWKKSLDEDDYHLYEQNSATHEVRQITSGRGFADYEPVYLPNDDLVFASTRCVQTVDCWWTEVSNLYTCDRNGRYLRRLGFDQVHTIYPQVLDDGRIIYTRWDYNDRGQIFPQPLFQMNPDGTGQTEFYGNNSWFPTTIAHARGIPGTQKVLAILCGHHTTQAGKLAVIDPSLGRQENRGVQLVAPFRSTPAERIDGYGQSGQLWQHPYPLNEHECLVAYAPLGWDHAPARQGDADFGIYWMNLDGGRELLASDARLACSQPVPLRPRTPPPPWAQRTDYRQTNGTFYVQNVYAGPGLQGVARGTIQKLRVIALQFRAAGVGDNGSKGPAGDALISTPISIGNGSWDVKVVLGEAKVHEDGSALFTVPARTPVYFQAIDEQGRAAQTMRSWATLQPGETAACVGCHEDKNTAPPAYAAQGTLASRGGPQELTPFYGPARGFSFAAEVQPVFDRHCVRCHRDRTALLRIAESGSTTPVLSPTRSARALEGKGLQDENAFSLLGDVVVDRTAKRQWSDSYLVLTGAYLDPDDYGAKAFQGNCQGRVVNWISAQSVPEPLPAYTAGAARSELLPMLRSGHKGVSLSREELDKISCWIDLLVPFCADYREANAWTEEEVAKYASFLEKRRRMEAVEGENIREWINAQTSLE